MQLQYRVRTTTSRQPRAITSIVNAASFAPVITPGALVWIRGTNLAAKALYTLDSTGRYPTKVAQTTVTFNGIPAPLLSTSTGAILAVVPNGLKGISTAHLRIRVGF